MTKGSNLSWHHQMIARYAVYRHHYGRSSIVAALWAVGMMWPTVTATLAGVVLGMAMVWLPVSDFLESFSNIAICPPFVELSCAQ